MGSRLTDAPRKRSETNHGQMLEPFRPPGICRKAGCDSKPAKVIGRLWSGLWGIIRCVFDEARMFNRPQLLGNTRPILKKMAERLPASLRPFGPTKASSRPNCPEHRRRKGHHRDGCTEFPQSPPGGPTKARFLQEAGGTD